MTNASNFITVWPNGMLQADAKTTNTPVNFDYVYDFINIVDDRSARAWCYFHIKKSDWNLRNQIMRN